MEFILLVFIVILWIYVARVSNRVEMLEKLVNNKPHENRAAVGADKPIEQTVMPVTPTQTVAAVEPKSEVVSEWDLSRISANTWMAIIGSLALLFGIGFFLKYAFDNGWLPPILKVFIGLGVGGLLVLLGEIWKDKYKTQSPVLSGGGISIIYISFAGWFHFFNLPQIAALIMALLTSAVAVILGFRYNSRAIVGLGIIGGYLAPIMFGTSSNQQIVLFVFLSILNLVVLSLLAKRYWIEIAFVSIIGSGFNFVLWGSQYSNTANFLPSLIFLLVNYLLAVVLIGIFFFNGNEKKILPVKSETYTALWFFLAGSGVSVGLMAVMMDQQKSLVAVTYLISAIITFLGYALLDRLNFKSINYVLAFIGFGMASIAIFIQWSGLNALWVFSGLILINMIIGFSVGQPSLRVMGLVKLYIAIFLTLAFQYSYSSGTTFLLNQKFALEILLAAMFIAVSYAYSKNKNSISSEEKGVIGLTGISGATVILIAISWEIMVNLHLTLIDGFNNLVLSLWWMGYAVILFVFSHTFNNLYIRKGSVLLGVLAVCKVFLFDVLVLNLGLRIISFITLGVILLTVSFMYQKNKTFVKQIWEGDKTNV
jgi:uncharacterized membrane protein